MGRAGAPEFPTSLLARLSAFWVSPLRIPLDDVARFLTSHMLHAGTKARLRSKHNLLATLVERVRDSSAYTRARVLQTWGHLAEASAIPLGHWVCVTELAVGTPPCFCRPRLKLQCEWSHMLETSGIPFDHWVCVMCHGACC